MVNVPPSANMNYVQRKVRVGEIVSDIRGTDVLFKEINISCEEVKIVGLFLVQQKESDTLGWWLNVAQSEDKVDEYLENQLKLGYEGIMLKKFDVPYFFGRSFDMLKYKRFKDAEFKIVDIEDGKGNKKGKATAVICVDDNGTEFKAGVTGTEEFAAEMFANKEVFIGKIATIKYQELTPVKDGKGGVPRFGKMTAIRDYE